MHRLLSTLLHDDYGPKCRKHSIIHEPGVLGIHPLARDIKIDNFSVTFYGAELLQDTKLELSCGNR